MSEKVYKSKRQKILRWCCCSLFIVNFILLVIIHLIWAILQPKKPRFYLQDATIFNLNVSAPNVISATLQVTIYSHNPNSKIGVYYDKMEVYATYQKQIITNYTVIPPVYQGHKDFNVFLYGNTVPVALYNGLALSEDQSNGAIRIKIDGRVKWKVGSFISGRYHLHISCPVDILNGNIVKDQLPQSCGTVFEKK